MNSKDKRYLTCKHCGFKVELDVPNRIVTMDKWCDDANDVVPKTFRAKGNLYLDGQPVETPQQEAWSILYDHKEYDCVPRILLDVLTDPESTNA